MADDKRDGSDDLFEDLDKFFAPIQDVDWPGPDDPEPPAPTRAAEEHVAVHVEAPAPQPPDEPDLTDEPRLTDDPQPIVDPEPETVVVSTEDDAAWYDTGVLETFDVSPGPTPSLRRRRRSRARRASSLAARRTTSGPTDDRPAAGAPTVADLRRRSAEPTPADVEAAAGTSRVPCGTSPSRPRRPRRSPCRSTTTRSRASSSRSFRPTAATTCSATSRATPSSRWPDRRRRRSRRHPGRPGGARRRAPHGEGWLRGPRRAQLAGAHLRGGRRRPRTTRSQRRRARRAGSLPDGAVLCPASRWAACWPVTRSSRCWPPPSCCWRRASCTASSTSTTCSPPPPWGSSTGALSWPGAYYRGEGAMLAMFGLGVVGHLPVVPRGAGRASQEPRRQHGTDAAGHRLHPAARRLSPADAEAPGRRLAGDHRDRAHPRVRHRRVPGGLGLRRRLDPTPARARDEPEEVVGGHDRGHASPPSCAP